MNLYYFCLQKTRAKLPLEFSIFRLEPPMSDLRIETYQEEFRPAFVSLNRQWIEHYFEIEEMDLKQLEDPQSSILDHGGEVFFVVKKVGETPVAVGTCAMVPYREGTYELAKMAVSPKFRGQGIADLLMTKIIDWARERGAKEVMLHSNTSLTPAIELYKKHGFETVHLGPHADYKRSDIEMALRLN